MNQQYITITVDGEVVLEHRYVMEQYLGRKLQTVEQVHHKNHCRYDNRIENLEIINRKDHGKKHSLEYWDLHKFAPKEKRYCVECGNEIEYKSKYGKKWFLKAKYCGIICNIKNARSHSWQWKKRTI